jgi:hypothetical protein
MGSTYPNFCHARSGPQEIGIGIIEAQQTIAKGGETEHVIIFHDPLGCQATTRRYRLKKKKVLVQVDVQSSSLWRYSYSEQVRYRHSNATSERSADACATEKTDTRTIRLCGRFLAIP